MNNNVQARLLNPFVYTFISIKASEVRSSAGAHEKRNICQPSAW